MTAVLQWLGLAWFFATLAVIATRIYAQAERRQRLARVTHYALVVSALFAIIGFVVAVNVSDGPGFTSLPERIFVSFLMGVTVTLFAAFFVGPSLGALGDMADEVVKVPLPDDDNYEDWAAKWSETVVGGNFEWETTE